MANPTGKGGFQERPHQINRKGRPKTFDALRKEALKVVSEIVTSQETGEQASVIHNILRDWAHSGDVRKQTMLVEVAYGKIPTWQTNLNINLDALTDEQLERIAKGEDVTSVIARARRGNVGVAPSAAVTTETDTT